MTMNLILLALLLPQADEADWVFRGATIHDGSGGPAVVGDVAVKGDRILAVGRWTGAARREVEAKGRILAPGFIDLHSHSDRNILDRRDNANFTAQGCTTVVTGNCGGGRTDVAAYLAAVDQDGAGTNVAHLVPHGAVRGKVLGAADRAPTPDELARMKSLLEQGLKDGAWGMSTGLIYLPGTFAKTDELVELAKVVASHGGLYASHIRSEADGLLEAIDEALLIGAQAGCPVHVSHLKCSTSAAWGKMEEVCRRIEAARAKGIRATADQYPYVASSTGLSYFTVPSWAQEGGKLIPRLDDPEAGPRIRAAIAERLAQRKGAETILIAGCAKRPAYEGRTIAQIAADEGKDPVEVVVQILRLGGASAIGFSMRDEDLRVAMGREWVATASDGSAVAFGKGHPHPRNYGTFPRTIGRFAIEEGRLPLAAAVRSASGLPADVLGMRDRGYVKPGLKADLVCFDPATFRDAATFEAPHRLSTGVRWLLVNGAAVIDDGRPTGARPGRALRR